MIKALIFDASDVLYDHRGADEQIFRSIEQLEANYKIAMITNLPTHAIDQYFSNEQQALFEYIHTYARAGLSKPDPEVFKHTAAELGLEPEQCLYTDDRHVNIEGAKKAGMQVILYKTCEMWEHQLKHLTEVDE